MMDEYEIFRPYGDDTLIEEKEIIERLKLGWTIIAVWGGSKPCILMCLKETT